MKNFRNFSERKVSFQNGLNLIIANNGSWKTNILEALSFPSCPLVETDFGYLLQQWKDNFFVGIESRAWKLGYSYDGTRKKKKYLLQETPSTKKKLHESYPHVISFHPMLMNLLYLGPSDRRNFLDTILANTFPEYKSLLTNYKKILNHRNKTLKNISEKKSDISELGFWNTKFIESASEVYIYREKIVTFFEEYIWSSKEYFLWKIENISFVYKSKTPFLEHKRHIETYIQENTQKEILLRKTLRWPHLDDFELTVDTVPLIHFASRWEVKSILIAMKLLEKSFLEKYSSKKDILYLIDDLLSELDSEHRDLILKNISPHQAIITSIEDIENVDHKIYLNT